MLKIGITGGIGSGKTTITKIFELLAVPIYYADVRGKWLLDHDETVKNAVKQRFGTALYESENNLLNRNALAAIVFANPLLLKELDAIVHPAVARDTLLWNEAMQQKGVAYTLQESALIYEAKIYLRLDKIITVSAPQEVRIQRVMERNKWTRHEILQRIHQQMPDEEKQQKADFIIINDGETALIKQCLAVHQQILALV